MEGAKAVWLVWKPFHGDSLKEMPPTHTRSTTPRAGLQDISMEVLVIELSEGLGRAQEAGARCLMSNF